MQIEPQVTLPLVYQLTDPFDSGTYYVRAVIFDSLSGDVIDTKNLASQGSGLYTSSIYAPADPLGSGRHVHVIISVYTDSGYSTYSDMYQMKIDKYLIKSSGPRFGGGSGGSDIDYEKIQKMIVKALEALLAGTKPQPADYSGVYKRLASLGASIEKAIAANKPEKPQITEEKPLDFSPVLTAIAAATTQVVKAIADKEVTEKTEVNLDPVIAGLEGIKTALDKVEGIPAELKQTIATSIEGGIKKAFEVNANRKKKMQDLLTELDNENYSIPAPEASQPRNPMVDRLMPKP